MLQTFKQRALEIADKAQNTRTVSQGDGSHDFMGGLDETERQRESRHDTHVPSGLLIDHTVFRAAHDGSNAIKKWFETTSRT